MKRKATSTNNRKKTKNDPLVSELKHALLERSHTQQSVWESNSRNTMEFNDSNRISCVKIHKLHQYADNIIGLDSKTIGVVNRKLYFTLRQYSTNDLTFTETGLVASEINHPQRFGKDYIVFREGISVKIYNIAKKLDVCSYNASRQSIITVLNDQYIMFNKANEFYFATLHKNSIKIVHSISYDFSGDYFSYCLTNDGRICIYNSDGSLDVIGLDSIVNIRPKGDESYTDGTLLKMVSRDEVLISLPYERPARLELWNIGTKQLVKEIQCNTQLTDMIVVGKGLVVCAGSTSTITVMDVYKGKVIAEYHRSLGKTYVEKRSIGWLGDGMFYTATHNHIMLWQMPCTLSKLGQQVLRLAENKCYTDLVVHC